MKISQLHIFKVFHIALLFHGRSIFVASNVHELIKFVLSSQVSATSLTSGELDSIVRNLIRKIR